MKHTHCVYNCNKRITMLEDVMMQLPDRVVGDPGFRGLLERIAPKYVWWQDAQTTLRHPALLVARVMNMGDYAEVQELTHWLSDDCLREILENAEVGQFNERSWAYWHFRLGLPASERVPPMPRRRLG